MIRLVVMMSVRFPLSVRNVEDLLFERGINLCHETVRMGWNRLTTFARMIATPAHRSEKSGDKRKYHRRSLR